MWQKVKIVPRLGRNLTIVVYLARWRSETDWNITISISADYINQQSFRYILWTCGEIWISDPGVLDV